MKKNIDVLRAWKDEDYFLSLTPEERASLESHPSGTMNLKDEVLGSISGGCSPKYTVYASYCTPCYPYECAV